MLVAEPIGQNPVHEFMDSFSKGNATDVEKSITDITREADRLWDNPKFRARMAEKGVDYSRWWKEAFIGTSPANVREDDIESLRGALKHVITPGTLPSSALLIPGLELNLTGATTEDLFDIHLFSHAMLSGLSTDKVHKLAYSGVGGQFKAISANGPLLFERRFLIDKDKGTLTPYFDFRVNNLLMINSSQENLEQRRKGVEDYLKEKGTEWVVASKITPDKKEDGMIKA